LTSLAAVTAQDGLAVIDAALWAGYLDEGRAEEWSVENPDGIVAARCSAKLMRSETSVPLRIEVLEFTKTSASRVYEARREAVLHAFTPSGLIELLEECGLRYSGCMSNGVALAPGELPVAGRAFMAFRRAATPNAED
jgi:hypothetical protein